MFCSSLYPLTFWHMEWIFIYLLSGWRNQHINPDLGLPQSHPTIITNAIISNPNQGKNWIKTPLPWERSGNSCATVEDRTSGLQGAQASLCPTLSPHLWSNLIFLVLLQIPSAPHTNVWEPDDLSKSRQPFSRWLNSVLYSSAIGKYPTLNELVTQHQSLTPPLSVLHLPD